MVEEATREREADARTMDVEQAVRVAGGEDDVRSPGAGRSGRLEPDAGARSP
jgi:hypothetical protein